MSWHNWRFHIPERGCRTHDDARPDAPTQELAQVEPGHCGPGVHCSLHPQLSRDRERPATTTSSRPSRGATSPSRRFRRAYQQQMQAYRAQLRRERRRKAAQTARHRPADRPADDRGGDGARRSVAARHFGDRRGSARADRDAAGAPGERPVHRRAALPPVAADAEPADAPGRVRGTGPARRDRARSSRRRSPTGSRSTTRSWKRSSSGATRKSSWPSSSFPADKFREGLEATDAELAAHFEEHKNELKMPEKRKVRYALVDMQAIRNRTQISPQDIQRSYEDNQQQYSTPEQVRASHILLKTEGKDEAAVKKQAEDLLAKVKAGADFAELATKHSRGRHQQGQGRRPRLLRQGQMVPEFDKVAFSLEPGQISDLVKTQFGFHIIKVTEKKAATHATARQKCGAQIEDQLKWERAQAEAQRIADDVAGKLKQPADLDTVAKPRGPDGRRVRLLQQGRADRRPRHGARGGRARLRAEGGRGQRSDSHAAGLCVHHRHGQAGRLRAEARRSEGARARRRAEEEGGRRRASARGDHRRADEVGRFQRGGQSRGRSRSKRPSSSRAARRLPTSAPAPRSTRSPSRCRPAASATRSSPTTAR